MKKGRSAGGIAGRMKRARPFASPSTARALTDETVTIRDRDSCRQWRVAAAGVTQAIGDLLEGQPIPAELPRARVVSKRREPAPRR